MSKRVKIMFSLPDHLKKRIIDEKINTNEYTTISEFVRKAVRNQLNNERYLKELSESVDNLKPGSEEYDRKLIEYVMAVYSPAGHVGSYILLREKQILLNFHRDLIYHIDKRLDMLEGKIMEKNDRLIK